MIQPLGQDVVKAHRDIGDEALPAGQRITALKPDFGAGIAPLQQPGKGLFDPLLTQHKTTIAHAPVQGQAAGAGRRGAAQG